jgi:hypothetical protein
MLGALTLRSWVRLATESRRHDDSACLDDRFLAIDAGPVRLK